MTTRRDFLKTMTMASAGLALGTGDLLGAPISVSQRKAAADKVKIAYVGIGIAVSKLLVTLPVRVW